MKHSCVYANVPKVPIQHSRHFTRRISSRMESLSPGAQQDPRHQDSRPARDRDAPTAPHSGSRAEVPPQARLCHLLHPGGEGEEKKHREKVKVPATPRGAVDAQVFLPDRWWEGEERGGGRKGTSSRQESEIGKLPAQPSALGDKNTRLAVSGSAEGPATGAKADAHDSLLRVPPRAVS